MKNCAENIRKKYDQTDKELKPLHVVSVDEVFRRSWSHKNVGHAKVNTITMLAHLDDNYARINSSALKESGIRLNQWHKTNHPIGNLIDQEEDIADHAAVGKVPCTENSKLHVWPNFWDWNA